jgi:hypothetical protein
MVKSGLEHETIGGRTYWFAASSAKAKARPSGVIDLVQGYDECILSYGESREVLLGPLSANAIPRLEIGFTHAVLLDGRLIGHWRPALERKSISSKHISTSRSAAPERRRSPPPSNATAGSWECPPPCGPDAEQPLANSCRPTSRVGSYGIVVICSPQIVA